MTALIWKLFLFHECHIFSRLWVRYTYLESSLWFHCELSFRCTFSHRLSLCSLLPYGSPLSRKCLKGRWCCFHPLRCGGSWVRLTYLECGCSLFFQSITSTAFPLTPSSCVHCAHLEDVLERVCVGWRSGPEQWCTVYLLGSPHADSSNNDPVGCLPAPSWLDFHQIWLLQQNPSIHVKGWLQVPSSVWSLCFLGNFQQFVNFKCSFFVPSSAELENVRVYLFIY